MRLFSQDERENEHAGSPKRALGEGFQFERRGTVEVRGKGEMELYYLTGRTG